MNLTMNPDYAEGYKSGSQIARRITEAWAESTMYCAACDSSSITATPTNTKAIDFICKNCAAAYQLKAMKTWSPHRVPDGSFAAMIAALQSDLVPNLLIMQYNEVWQVQNLLLIPSFFFSPSAIEKRKPLAPTARRAGWIGCNILLSEIAKDGKINVVSRGTCAHPKAVRAEYSSTSSLSKLKVPKRGWALDVLRIVRRMDRDSFTLSDIYEYESILSEIYPNNKNIRPKIRQQLQVLRDLDYIDFEGRGRYKMLR